MCPSVGYCVSLGGAYIEKISQTSFCVQRLVTGGYHRNCWRQYVSIYVAIVVSSLTKLNCMGQLAEPIDLIFDVGRDGDFLPIILAYTAWVYRVLRGKVTENAILANEDIGY